MAYVFVHLGGWGRVRQAEHGAGRVGNEFGGNGELGRALRQFGDDVEPGHEPTESTRGARR